MHAAAVEGCGLENKKIPISAETQLSGAVTVNWPNAVVAFTMRDC